MSDTARKRTPAPKKKAPGKSIPDAQRHTVKLQLRVDRAIARLVREHGKSEGGASSYVSRLVLADAVAAPTSAGVKPALQTQRKRLRKLAEEAGIDLDETKREDER